MGRFSLGLVDGDTVIVRKPRRDLALPSMPQPDLERFPQAMESDMERRFLELLATFQQPQMNVSQVARIPDLTIPSIEQTPSKLFRRPERGFD